MVSFVKVSSPFNPGHDCPSLSFRSLTTVKGRSQDFSKGGGGRGPSRDTIQGSPTIYGLYRCSPSCISGLSRITVA